MLTYIVKFQGTSTACDKVHDFAIPIRADGPNMAAWEGRRWMEKNYPTKYWTYNFVGVERLKET